MTQLRSASHLQAISGRLPEHQQSGAATSLLNSDLGNGPGAAPVR